MQYCETNDRFYNCDIDSCHLDPRDVGTCHSDPELSKRCFCPRRDVLVVDPNGNLNLVDQNSLIHEVDETRHRLSTRSRQREDGVVNANTRTANNLRSDIERDARYTRDTQSANLKANYLPNAGNFGLRIWDTNGTRRVLCMYSNNRFRANVRCPHENADNWRLPR